METNQIFIKADNNKIINERCIRWIKKMDECLLVCTKSNGCSNNQIIEDKHTICKLNNPDSYNKLNQLF
jgi:hypothetical protein